MKEPLISKKKPTNLGFSKIPSTGLPDYWRELFDNLPKLMRTEQFVAHFGYSRATIYDWRYRGLLRGVPPELFLSLNRRLYIRTDIFMTWIASQNPELGVKGTSI